MAVVGGERVWKTHGAAVSGGGIVTGKFKKDFEDLFGVWRV
jgi:hypothetical protein